MRRGARHFTIVLLALLAAASWCAGCSVFGVQDCRGDPAAQAPWAEAYYQWLCECLDGLEKDIPRITRSAEAAARRYVLEGGRLGSFGDDCFAYEAVGRSGGIVMMLHPSSIASRGKKDVVLFVLGADTLQEDLRKAAEFKKQGKMVIAFARRSVLAAAQKAGAEFDAEVDTHAAEHDGLFPGPDGTWLVPTVPTANVAALWTWTGEFVAACTRLGKMPVMWQGYAVPGGRQRAKKYGRVKFHDHVPAKVGPGRIAREFLRELRKDLSKLRCHEMADISAAAALAVKTRSQGRGVYTFLHGHALYKQMYPARPPHDPGYFTQINKDWFEQRDDIELAPGDFVLCVGFDSLFRGKQYHGFAQKARQAGATLIWSVTAYKTEEMDAIAPGEMLIDQHWDFGDAVATVPGYDIKILPTSGVLSEAVLWMVTAEVHRMLCHTAAPAPKRRVQ